MEILSAIRSRRSIRRWTREPVAKSDLKVILKSAGWAPSPTNTQPWHFITILNAALITKVVDLIINSAREAATSGSRAASMMVSAQEFASNAPCIIAAFAKPYASNMLERFSKPNTFNERFDLRGAGLALGAALQNLMLAAHSLNYGSCCLMPISGLTDVANQLNMRPPWSLYALVALGRPTETPPPPKRKKENRLYTIME